MKKKKVGFFVTCLIDIAKPIVGESCLSLLDKLGYEVFVPLSQTCCGQISLNSGDVNSSKKIARKVIDAFIEFDYVVVPSSSCASILKFHYPKLFENDEKELKLSNQLASKTYEICQFIDLSSGEYLKLAGCQNNQFINLKKSKANKISYCYISTCSSLREMKSCDIAQNLLAKLNYLTHKPISNPEICCGFGGLFSVKNPEISNQMVSDKCLSIINTNAMNVIAQDAGCLLNIEGKIRSMNNHDIKFWHISSVLNGDILNYYTK